MSSNGLESIVYAIFALISAELAVNTTGANPSASMRDIGQVMPVILAVVTVLNAIWLLLRTQDANKDEESDG